MRLKKRKVTIVEHGRLVHLVTRYAPNSIRGVIWLPGHVSPNSRRGQALLVAEALR